MILADCENERLNKEFEPAGVLLGFETGQRYVHPLLIESALQPIKRVIKQCDGDIGASAPECPDKVGDAYRRERLQDANPQHARGCNCTKIGFDAVARQQNTASRLEEPASGGRRYHPVAAPLEELHAHLRLELRNGGGQRRLRYRHPSGPPCEAAGLGHRHELPNLIKLHE
jgi:hypothetical protein